MLLAIDAGNTNVVFAVFGGGALVGQWRILSMRGVRPMNMAYG